MLSSLSLVALCTVPFVRFPGNKTTSFLSIWWVPLLLSHRLFCCKQLSSFGLSLEVPVMLDLFRDFQSQFIPQYQQRISFLNSISVSAGFKHRTKLYSRKESFIFSSLFRDWRLSCMCGVCVNIGKSKSSCLYTLWFTGQNHYFWTHSQPFPCQRRSLFRRQSLPAFSLSFVTIGDDMNAFSGWKTWHFRSWILCILWDGSDKITTQRLRATSKAPMFSCAHPK
jgi:hypothetical protein